VTVLSASSRLRLYLLSLFLSLALLLYSMEKMTPIIVDVEDFLGLPSHLPVSYWIGLLIVLVGSGIVFYDSGLKSDALLVSLLLMGGLYLVAAPALAQTNLRGWLSPETTNVLTTGHVDVYSPLPFSFYRSWPANHFILVSMAQVTGVTEIMGLAKYGPLFTLPPLVLITFSLGRRLGLSPQCSFGLTYLVLVSLWMPWTFNINAVFTAYLTYMLLFFLLAGGATNPASKQRLLPMLVFAQLVITHLLTSLVVVLFSIFRSVRSRPLFWVAMLFVVPFSAWYLYLTPSMFSIGVKAFWQQVLEFDPFFFRQTTKFAPATGSAQMVNAFRLAYLGILGLPMLAAMGAYALGRVKTENRPRVRTCLYWILPALPLAFLTLSGEFYERAYLFVLLPAACIIFLTISNRAVLVALMLAATTALIPARYGAESTWMTYTSELRGAEFLSMKTRAQQVYYDYVVYAWYYNPDYASVRAVGYEPWKVRQSTESLASSDYVVDSRMQDNTMRYYFGFDYVQSWLKQGSKPTDLLYDNGDFRIYNAATETRPKGSAPKVGG
jgi:hypothetical protein